VKSEEQTLSGNLSSEKEPGKKGWVENAKKGGGGRPQKKKKTLGGGTISKKRDFL